MDAGIEDTLCTMAFRVYPVVNSTEVRSATLCFIGEATPIHFGHHDIGEQHGDLRLGINDAESGTGAVSLEDGVTEFPKRFDQHLPNLFLVLDHQNDFPRAPC